MFFFRTVGRPGDHIFDLCYSVSAVHYLASDSLTQSAARRIGQLTSSVRRILRPKGRPCTLQAYMKLGREMMQVGWTGKFYYVLLYFVYLGMLNL